MYFSASHSHCLFFLLSAARAWLTMLSHHTVNSCFLKNAYFNKDLQQEHKMMHPILIKSCTISAEFISYMKNAKP